MLKLGSIAKEYRRGGEAVLALRDATAAFDAATFNVIKGPSGSGKSTLLLTLGGMLRPSGGTVHVEGTDLYAAGPQTRSHYRATTVGFVFQMLHLLPYLNVMDNVLTAKSESSGREQRARDLLTKLGLADRMKHRPRELSAGERQRAAVARALVNGPKIILADEPTGNLDPENSDIIMRAFAEFRDAGGTVVLVTHNPDADPYADVQFTLREGVLEKV